VFRSSGLEGSIYFFPVSFRGIPNKPVLFLQGPRVPLSTSIGILTRCIVLLSDAFATLVMSGHPPERPNVAGHAFISHAREVREDAQARSRSRPCDGNFLIGPSGTLKLGRSSRRNLLSGLFRDDIEMSRKRSEINLRGFCGYIFLLWIYFSLNFMFSIGPKGS
jgi:hypothetical protein